MNSELELFKLVTSEDLVEELGWVNESSFYVWISYHDIKEFMEELKGIFGNGIYDDGSFAANMQEYGLCIDLCEAVGDFIDVEGVFPKDKYPH